MDLFEGTLFEGMAMFGPKSPKDRAFEEAITIIDFDEQSNEEPYASEPIIKSAWNHVNRMVHDPASVARSLPWDALPFHNRESKLSYVDELLKYSTVVWDSDVGFISSGRSGNDCAEEDDGDESDDEEGGDSKQAAKSTKNDHCTNSEWEEEQEQENDDDQGRSEQSGQINRLDGKQLYSDHYVDRFLPGAVYKHPVDGRPTNAIAWDKSVDFRMDIDWEHYKELSRTHPGDNIRDHENFPQENSSACDYEEECYCPVVTKAGSRLWSISFVAAPDQLNNGVAPCADLKASYPGQLTIRYDIGRHMLIYDLFEFKPTTVDQFKLLYSSGQDVCTESELAEVEKLLRSTKRKRRQVQSLMQFTMGMEPSKSPEFLSSENSMQERIDAIGEHKYCHLLNYIRFKKSRLMRVRFQLHGLRGVRLIEMKYQRPNEDLPAAKGVHPLSRLGDPGEEGIAPGHNTFEKSDDSLEPLGLLVLEFGDTCGNFLSTDGGTNSKISNSHPFASTVAWPKRWQERMRLPYTKDWTPDQMFSKSRRHYIVGDWSEMLELTNFLMSKNSSVRNMLSLPMGKEHASAKKVLNSLSGCTSMLTVNATPADTFSHVVQMKNDHSSSVATLKNLCVNTLVNSSSLELDKTTTRQFETEGDVHNFLRRCGIDEPEGVNRCLKAALLNEKMKVPEELLHAEDASSWLSQTLLTKKCSSCKQNLTSTIGQVIYQDHCASQTRDGECDRAPIHCGGFFCSGRYVTNLCQGIPRFDRDNHNHCTQCPSFGRCIGYWRNNHCADCGGHYITGNQCEGCKSKKIVDEFMQTKSNEDEDSPTATSWDGIIRGSFKPRLIEESGKKELIKMLRQQLLLVPAMSRDEDLAPKLREKLSSVPDNIVDDIVENGCRAKLDTISWTYLSEIVVCLNSLIADIP